MWMFDAYWSYLQWYFTGGPGLIGYTAFFAVPVILYLIGWVTRRAWLEEQGRR
jgi:hypothetical protein